MATGRGRPGYFGLGGHNQTFKCVELSIHKMHSLLSHIPAIEASIDYSDYEMWNDSGVYHWAEILCHLKGALGHGILYINYEHSHIECFSDADWASSKIDRRPTTGYCVFVGGNFFSWKSKKQNVVSRFSAESEYRAITQSVCEIILIYQLLNEVGLKASVPAKLWCDNQVALHIASNPMFHERTKHIEIDCHFPREKLLDSCLKSLLLPAYLAAAFCKKLSRLALCVPPFGALAVALVHNLLQTSFSKLFGAPGR